jgi:hypothetical protein
MSSLALLKNTLVSLTVVEWLIFLFRFREVTGSNLGAETGYLDCGFS